MDYTGHFIQDVTAFEAAGQAAAGEPAAPAVPSCPGWTVTDLILHLGTVHRLVDLIFTRRLREPPQLSDQSWLELAPEWGGWLPPGRAREHAPVPPALLGWFRDGAARLHQSFRTTDAGEPVWTWSADQTAGFWLRMQAIEAAVHRWDAEQAIGRPRPLDAALAADAVTQTFQIMAPFRRAIAQAPPGQGERYLFERTDGPEKWAVQFDGDAIRLSTTGDTPEGAPGPVPGGVPGDASHVRISGTASDLALYLWRRADPAGLDVQGAPSLLTRYFTLVPPL